MPRFSEIKKQYNYELSSLYSDSEIKQLLKITCFNVLKINDSDYLLLGDSDVGSKDALQFQSVLNRLVQSEPIQHIFGTELFYGLQLKVDGRALIPRPETEELVRWIVSSQDSNGKLMDLCAGSGCIALAMKSELPETEILAVELSPQAIQLIKENLELTQLQIDVVEGDVLSSDFYNELEDNSFDCWVSNPPYIPFGEKRLMSSNVLDYEPDMALFVTNEDPLVFYRVIAQNAINKLIEGGSLFFEINENLADDVVQLLKDYNFVNIELRKDLQGKDRMIRAIK